jgi:hypothetical protein
VSSLERLVSFLLAQYRWGFHPLKLLVALLIPIVIVWVADRYVRRRSDALALHEAELRRLPKGRRR